ncbi:MAG: hypothetical protein KDC34_15075 [Saprospiraceae bacterium]|nr:hypothetical protein [Saprospiraceae bacterium]
MKRPAFQALFLTFASLLFSGSLMAQTKTLFDDVEVKGAFGGPLIEFSEINGQTGVGIGGGGALVLNDFFLGGYGMSNRFATVVIEENKRYIDFGHGGIWLGYTYRPDKLIHLYSDVKVGWGKARIKETRDDDDEFSIYADPFFTVSPQLGLELNLTHFMKVGFTGGYRFVTGIDELPSNLTDDLFSSPFGTITVRFGGFDDSHHDDDYEDEWDN